MAVSSLDYLWVAAIDFGTTFSGYAFGGREELEVNPTKTSAPVWQAADGGLISSKTPTTVLLDKDEKLVDFGFDAETAYAELSEDEEHEEYYYFRRFKMMLYDKVRKSVRKPFPHYVYISRVTLFSVRLVASSKFETNSLRSDLVFFFLNKDLLPFNLKIVKIHCLVFFKKTPLLEAFNPKELK